MRATVEPEGTRCATMAVIMSPVLSSARLHPAPQALQIALRTTPVLRRHRKSAAATPSTSREEVGAVIGDVSEVSQSLITPFAPPSGVERVRSRPEMQSSIRSSILEQCRCASASAKRDSSRVDQAFGMQKALFRADTSATRLRRVAESLSRLHTKLTLLDRVKFALSARVRSIALALPWQYCQCILLEHARLSSRDDRQPPCWPALSAAPCAQVTAGPDALPVVILPGFGNCTDDYTRPFGDLESSLASVLQRRGFQTYVPQVRGTWARAAQSTAARAPEQQTLTVSNTTACTGNRSGACDLLL